MSSMTDAYPTWIERLTTVEQRWLAAVLILAVLLMLLYLLRGQLRNWREKRRITRAAKRLGARILRDVHLPDGMGSELSIDFLVLATDAILVIDVKRYDGMIFGSANTDEWTQTLNSRSYKFPNPDAYLLHQVGAVRNVVRKTPVRGLHLFSDNAVFPWDKPSNVLQVKDMLCSDTRRPRLKDIPVELREAWKQFTRALRQ
jgi:hypothetical protein